MTPANIEILKNNCFEYAKTGKSIGVLRIANGKNHYKEIAKITGLHPTKVSGLLKKAEKLGLAKKTGLGIYRKIPGILGYMPLERKIGNKSSKTIKDSIEKLQKINKVKKICELYLAFPCRVKS